jgi:hypothetical protein
MSDAQKRQGEGAFKLGIGLAAQNLNRDGRSSASDMPVVPHLAFQLIASVSRMRQL